MIARALEPEPLEVHAGAQVARIRFGEGSALLVTPADVAPGPVGIVIAHGGFEPGAHIFLDEAAVLAGRGATVVLPQVTFPSSQDVAEHEAAIVRAIATQRGAVDVLDALGAARFGFFGHSAGGAQGALLSTLEPRLRAIVIAGSGAGLLSSLREPLVPAAALARIARFDPENWVGADHGRSLLFQHGVRDDVVSLEAGRGLYELAAGRKRWVEYDCGHGIDGEESARADRLAFFALELGL